MGFDMYLNKKIEVDTEYSNITGTIALQRENTPITIRFNKLKFIIERQAAWYNAYSIHKWFVNNVQDGYDNDGYYEVYGEVLLKLVDICKKILENKDLAKTLLPSVDSYGNENQEYNEHYFKQLEDVIEQLNDVEKDAYYEYSSGW